MSDTKEFHVGELADRMPEPTQYEPSPFKKGRPPEPLQFEVNMTRGPRPAEKIRHGAGQHSGVFARKAVLR